MLVFPPLFLTLANNEGNSHQNFLFRNRKLNSKKIMKPTQT